MPFITFILLLLSAEAYADPLSLSSQAYTEEIQDGSAAIRTPATRVSPGTELLMIITAQNTTGSALKEVVIDNPVPAGTRYQKESQSGPADCVLEVSGDGEHYRSEAEESEQITDLRWRLPLLAPGSHTELQFRIRVNMPASVTDKVR